MRILKIWDADYPWDVRVEKICKSLFKSGHEVHIISRNLKKNKIFEKLDYCHVHRLPFLKNKNLNSIISFPAFFNPLWLHSISKLLKQYKFDIIIVRDLPLALTGIMIGRKFKIPVIMDMAENYPFLIEDIVKYEPFRLQNFFVRNKFIVHLVENITLRKIDHVIAVVDESKDRILKISQLTEDKVSVVSNTPQLYDVDDTHINKCYEMPKNKFILVYVGGIRIGRGLDQVLDAIPEITRDNENFCFLIVGEGKDKKILEEKAKTLNILDFVRFEGWVDPSYVPFIISNSDVGIIPHYVTNHTNHTIPNKLFDYMRHGLPVISSETIPIKRILDTEQCGATYKDSKELANVIRKLMSKDLQKQLGTRGNFAVQRRYNWQHDSQILKAVIDKFIY